VPGKVNDLLVSDLVVDTVLNDPARLEALHASGLLDTPNEAAFDRLTRLAASLCGAPMALVSLVDSNRQFFKSAVGLDEPWRSRRETPLSHSFCQFAVASGLPFVIDDARQHEIVAENLGVPELGMVAYAGVPLITEEGAALGSLCVIDHAPRQWTAATLTALEDLAALAMTEIGLRGAVARMRQARDQAVEAARLRSEFLATMSHEIRTPLHGLIGMATLLGETPLSSEQQGYLRTLNGCGDMLLGIVNDVLDLARLEAGRLNPHAEAINVARLVEEVMHVLSSKAREKRLDLRVTIEPDVPTQVWGDGPSLRRVLTNLTSNAVKFTEAGHVSISVSRVPNEPGLLRFDVHDTGCGMAPDQIARLFQPFSQVSDSASARHEGSGLGLAICRKLVEVLDGDISVRSRPGDGSHFWFTAALRRLDPSLLSDMPVDQTETEALSPGDWPVAAPRVLVAEDNEVNRFIATRYLRAAGCEVDAVVDGAEAVEACARRDYALVFMDCRMPGVDGIEATRLIRAQQAQRRRVPIVALTANAFQEERERCLAAGMDDFATKPLRRDDLYRLITRWAHPVVG
jgi:signal transduction histidine kinase/CheY-like chemotaxis protein